MSSQPMDSCVVGLRINHFTILSALFQSGFYVFLMSFLLAKKKLRASGKDAAQDINYKARVSHWLIKFLLYVIHCRWYSNRNLCKRIIKIYVRIWTFSSRLSGRMRARQARTFPPFFTASSFWKSFLNGSTTNTCAYPPFIIDECFIKRKAGNRKKLAEFFTTFSPLLLRCGFCSLAPLGCLVLGLISINRNAISRVIRLRLLIDSRSLLPRRELRYSHFSSRYQSQWKLNWSIVQLFYIEPRAC